MTRLLLEWVLTASLLILAVLALRALLGKRISAGLKYALWAVVLVRLLVPLQFFSLPVPDVLPEADRAPAAVSAVPAPAIQGETVGVPAIVAPVPSGVVTNYNTPMEPETVTLDVVQIGTVLGWLWLAGALVMTAAFLISNLTFALRLRRVRVPLEGADCPLPVYIAGGLPSPCLFGLFRPAVYVTAETAQNPAMLRHILAHEYTHFRHGDHVWNVLRSAALAVHWWNPLVWLAVVLSRRDCELACDEGALKRLGEVERIAYGRTLLALITVKPRPGDLLRCSTTMTGGQKSVFDRVTRIAKAPKRWLWAAVAAVIATALACVCAFGQADKPDTPPAAGVTADLTFSLGMDSDGNTYVRMDGTVDGVKLTRGASWAPPWRGMMTKKFPYGRVSMVYPPFTDGIEGHLTAGWSDEDHTKVVLTTEMTAMLSSLFNVGYWEFTVELDSGAVSMEGLSFRDGLPDGETRFYPESISEEEAVRVARVAAKLLTAAEDYYNNYAEDVPYLYTALLRGASFYSVDAEKSLAFDAIAEALDPYSHSYEITRYASVDFDGDGSEELVLYVKQQGEFYLIFHEIDGELYSYLCGTKVMPLIKRDGTVWDNYVYPPEGDGQGEGYSKVSFSKTGMEFHPFTYVVNLPSMEDGTAGNYRLVVDGQPADDQTYAAAEAALEAKPDVTWYQLTLKDLDTSAPVIDPGILDDLDGLVFSDGWHNSVNVEGVDVQEMYWYSPEERYRPYGRMFFTNPAFLGPAFEGKQVNGSAQWTDGGHTAIEIGWSWDSLPYLDFSVDLAGGTIDCDAVWDGLTGEELLTAARTLGALMERAEAYKTSADYRPPMDGPLPFERPMELMFCSGAGAWQTNLLLYPDGSFEGDFHDADMTIEYVCLFHGRFGDIRQVTDASWSLTLEELVLDTKYPVGTEWDEGVIHYISSTPYGFDKKGGEGTLEPGAQFMLYTPEAEGYRPTDELYGMEQSDDYESTMRQFWSWWPDKHVWGPYSGPLGCYGLCNMASGQGFFDLNAWGIA